MNIINPHVNQHSDQHVKYPHENETQKQDESTRRPRMRGAKPHAVNP